MIVKKYEAPTMQKALEAVKKDLGNDAVILHTKTKTKNHILGLWGKEMVEITASRDINVLERSTKAHTGNLIRYYKKAVEMEQARERDVSAPVPQQTPDIQFLHKDLTEIKTLVLDVLKRSKHSDVADLNDELLEAYMLLIENEVCEELSKEIIALIKTTLPPEELSNKAHIRATLMNTVARMMCRVDPIDVAPGAVKKIALIGPTGVGKTTTIAKLAAHFALKEKKDVALITIYTYRIAAVDQLRTYAEIINIPLEVVLTPQEMKRALERHQHRDLVFIDTAGRSQKNTMQMNELKSFIDIIKPDETHLVISTTSNVANAEDIIRRFEEISFQKIIFTKLDEAMSFGLVLNVAKKLNKSLSYVTTGQNVPDDISIGDPEMIARLIVQTKDG